MAELILKLSGIFLGVLVRTMAPYLRKLKQGRIRKFGKKYRIQAWAALALGIITTLLVFPQFNITKPGVGIEASVKLFCLAFGFGFGCNSIVAEAAKWVEGKK